MSISGLKRWRNPMAGKKGTTLLDALRVIFNDARLACGNPNSNPAIKQLLLTKPYLRRLVQSDVRMHLLSVGLDAEIRRYLKGDRDPEEGDVTVAQLDLWPKHCRTVVKDI